MDETKVENYISDLGRNCPGSLVHAAVIFIVVPFQAVLGRLMVIGAEDEWTARKRLKKMHNVLGIWLNQCLDHPASTGGRATLAMRDRFWYLHSFPFFAPIETDSQLLASGKGHSGEFCSPIGQAWNS
jgi:hypothetical protein